MLEYSAKLVLSIQNFLASTPFLISLWRSISGISTLAAIVIFVILYLCISRRAGRIIFISFMTSILISSLLKILLKEPRPFIFNPDIANFDEFTATGFSFPSSHCIFFTSFATSLTYEYKAKIIILPASIIVFLLALARVALGAHYIHDCLFSILVAILISFIVSFLNYSYRYSDASFKVAGLLGALVFILLIHFALIHRNNAGYDNVLYCAEALLSFLIGDNLERKYISISTSARVLKRALRVVFFIITSAVMVPLFYALRSVTNYAAALFTVFYSLYFTYFFTKLALISNLFERP